MLGALTGAILAGESVYNQSLPYKSNEFEGATLAQTLRALKYTDVDALKLTVDRNHFVKVETTEGKTLFIHPQSAKVIEGNYQIPAFIQFVKTLHRSLYLGKTGRVVMGLTALYCANRSVGVGFLLSCPRSVFIIITTLFWGVGRCFPLQLCVLRGCI